MMGDHEKDDAARQDYLTDVAICRAFLRAMWEPTEGWAQKSAPTLGRSDLDWNRLGTYVTECGLARPLLSRLKHLELPPWMPSHFLERLRTRAEQDAVADLIKREALEQIAQTLRKIGARGVLLKGSALMVLRSDRGVLPAQRATGDIDIHVEAPMASMLRMQLLKDGFRGAVDEPRSAAHHLAPVLFRGMAIEIHEHLMPSFWQLPERQMLANARPVATIEPLATLSPEGLLLHAGVHASSHLFAYGLKTAWDLLWVIRRFPELDWDRLADWVNAGGLPRAFWVPVRVLAQELSIPLPVDFLRHAPSDRRETNLETMARHRLFSALEGPFDMNPFSKTGVFLLLHDSWMDRLRYLSGLREENAAEARSAAQQHHPMRTSKQLREAFSMWRRYRRSISRVPAPPANL